jgi:Kef-type K+ transport system membrane component KefB
LNFIYWLGWLLLMFLSGAETQQVFTREERREVGWLTMVSTGIPFVLAWCSDHGSSHLRSPVRRATALPSL